VTAFTTARTTIPERVIRQTRARAILHLASRSIRRAQPRLRVIYPPALLSRFRSLFDAFCRSPGSARNQKWWITAIALAAVAVVLSVVASSPERHTNGFSVFDEVAHYDYVVHLYSGHIPRTGTIDAQPTVRASTCLAPGYKDPTKCAIKYRPTTSYSYEDIQPPLGYIPYALTANPRAQPYVALGHARRGGIVWAVIAAVLAVALAAVEEMSLLQLAGVLALCLLCPWATFMEGLVTNDSSAVTAGLLSLLVTSLASRRGTRWQVAVGLAAGIVIGLLKALFLFAPVAVLMAALVTGGSRPTSRKGLVELARRNAGSLAMVAGTVLMSVGWVIFQRIRELVPLSTVSATVESSVSPHLQSGTLLGGIANMLGVFNDPLGTVHLYAVLNYVVIGTAIAVAIFGSPMSVDRNIRALAGATVGAIVLLDVWFWLQEFIDGHQNYVAPTRYALVFVPLFAVVLVKVGRRWPTLLICVALPLAAFIEQLMTFGY
jgi:hypothetical protein